METLSFRLLWVVLPPAPCRSGDRRGWLHTSKGTKTLPCSYQHLLSRHQLSSLNGDTKPALWQNAQIFMPIHSHNLGKAPLAQSQAGLWHKSTTPSTDPTDQGSSDLCSSRRQMLCTNAQGVSILLFLKNLNYYISKQYVTHRRLDPDILLIIPSCLEVRSCSLSISTRITLKQNEKQPGW